VIAPRVRAAKVGYGGKPFEVARGNATRIFRVHVCGPLGAEKMQCECHKGDKGKVQMA